MPTITFNSGLTPATAEAMFEDNLLTCDQIYLTTTGVDYKQMDYFPQKYIFRFAGK